MIVKRKVTKKMHPYLEIFPGLTAPSFHVLSSRAFRQGGGGGGGNGRGESVCGEAPPR